MDTENSNKNQVNQEDKNFQVGEVVSRTEQFLERNRKIIIVVVAVVVVAIAGFMAYKHLYVAPKEKRAQAELFAAQQYFQNEDFDKALNGDGRHPGVLSVADEYSSTKAGKLARYYAGVIYLNKGEFQKAIDYLSKFSPKDELMSAQSKALLGDAYAELNQMDKALSEYKAAAKVDNEMTAPFVLLKMGQIYEIQKNYKEALECYKTIKQNYPRSMEFREVEKYIARMEAMM